MSQPDAYEQYIADWKKKQGIPEAALDASDVEQVMAAEDAKAKGKDYCMGCGEQFKICEMKLVTDPHMQFDDRPDRKDDYIPKKYRVRMCTNCFANWYEQED